MSKTYSGFNENTAKNLLLDTGAVFVNFDISKDTFATAKSTKLLGATSGGNKFEAKPSFREVKVDGVKGKAKGLQVLESWEVSLTTNLLEFTPEALKKSLAAAIVTDKTINTKNYTEIKAKNYIEDTDYIDNITFVGSIAGNDEPVIVQVFNVLNKEGLGFEIKEGSDATTEIKFEGHYDPVNLDNPPFAIYYPKEVTPTTLKAPIA